MQGFYKTKNYIKQCTGTLINTCKVSDALCAPFGTQVSHLRLFLRMFRRLYRQLSLISTCLKWLAFLTVFVLFAPYQSAQQEKEQREMPDAVSQFFTSGSCSSIRNVEFQRILTFRFFDLPVTDLGAKEERKTPKVTKATPDIYIYFLNPQFTIPAIFLPVTPTHIQTHCAPAESIQSGHRGGGDVDWLFNHFLRFQ